MKLRIDYGNYSNLLLFTEFEDVMLKVNPFKFFNLIKMLRKFSKGKISILSILIYRILKFVHLLIFSIILFYFSRLVFNKYLKCMYRPIMSQKDSINVKVPFLFDIAVLIFFRNLFGEILLLVLLLFILVLFSYLNSINPYFEGLQ